MTERQQVMIKVTVELEYRTETEVSNAQEAAQQLLDRLHVDNAASMQLNVKGAWLQSAGVIGWPWSEERATARLEFLAKTIEIGDEREG